MLGGRRSERIGRGGRASLSFVCADMQICRYAGKIEGKKLGLFKVDLIGLVRLEGAKTVCSEKAGS